MKRRRISLAAGILAVLCLVAATGCEAVVQDAARSSIASFLNSVLSSAVNASVNPG